MVMVGDGNARKFLSPMCGMASVLAGKDLPALARYLDVSGPLPVLFVHRYIAHSGMWITLYCFRRFVGAYKPYCVYNLYFSCKTVYGPHDVLCEPFISDFARWLRIPLVQLPIYPNNLLDDDTFSKFIINCAKEIDAEHIVLPYVRKLNQFEIETGKFQFFGPKEVYVSWHSNYGRITTNTTMELLKSYLETTRYPMDGISMIETTECCILKKECVD